jgi:hypothetical protein
LNEIIGKRALRVSEKVAQSSRHSLAEQTCEKKPRSRLCEKNSKFEKIEKKFERK